ncbi:MAG TPA: hypothetical protein VMT76_11905 [Puia sp.]|nr:hypothetical protein [Puia sp.]
MKIKSFVSFFFLTLYVVNSCFSQSDLQKMLNSANAIKKNSPSKNNQSQPGLPPGYDNSWKIKINISRTIVGSTNLVSKNSGCKSTKRGSLNYILQSDLSTDKAVASLNGDDFQLQTDLDENFRKYANSFTGSYNINCSSQKTETGCGGSSDEHFSGSSNVQPSDIKLTFEYNKKSKQGDFQIAILQDPFIQASGKGVYKQKDNPTVTLDLSEAGKVQIAMLTTLCGLFQSWNYPVAKDAKVQQALSSSPLNGGQASIGLTKFGYEISYSESKTINDVPDGWSGENVMTYTTNVQILITNQNPPEYDAIIELVNASNISNSATGYEKWIPEGPPPHSNNPAANGITKGNSIAFDVYLIDKKKPDQRISGIKYDVDFKLTDVSIEPGYCNNYPLNATDKGKSDLKFDESLKNASHATYDSQELKTKDYYGENFIAIVTSYDYGSFGKLTATVALEYGTQIPAHFKNDKKTVITLPKDDNDNQIADEWEIEQGIYQKNYSALWDGEIQNNNNHDGDGLTLYEEYRGIIAKGQHKRLNPKMKDIIIANTSQQKLDEAIGFFSKACNGSIVPIEVKAGDELDVDNPIVNKNSDFAKSGDQYGIVLKIVNDLIGDDGTTVLGQAFVKKNIAIGAENGNGLQSHIPGANEPVAASPKDVNYLALNTALLDNNALFDYSFAHELGHCLGVQHHGNSKTHQFDNFDRYLFQKKDFLFISEDGTPQKTDQFLNNLKNNIPMEAALPGSQAGGDVGCIMCYNQAYEFSFPNDIKGNVLIVCDIRYPNGTYFCINQNGTKRNDSNTSKKHPYSVFGNATTGGNCTGSILVKDW